MDRHTVLVIEDDPLIRELAVEALRDAGYAVLEAMAGGDAIVIFEGCPEIDVVFTDIVMPGIDGFKLADMIKVRRPGVKILYTTGYARNAIVHQGRLDPGVELIVKPFTSAALAGKIRQLLDGTTG